MNQILTLAFSACLLLATAQTPLISHKSHSGTAMDFFIDPSTNFGEYIPLPKLIQVIRLNDSTYVNVYLDEYSKYVSHDTVHQHIDYNFAFDSINEGFRTDVEYLHFRKSSPELEPVGPGYQKAKNQQIPEINTPITPEQPGKKKKSYLLFLFGITGGGMLLTRLFSRSKNITPSITKS